MHIQRIPGKLLFQLLFVLVLVMLLGMTILHSTMLKTKKPIMQNKNIMKVSLDKDVMNFLLAIELGSNSSAYNVLPLKEIVHEPVDNKYPRTIPNITGMLNHLQFGYIISQKDLCNRQSIKPYIFIYVHSDPKNFNYRMIIRKTWGNQTMLDQLHISIGFMLGKYSSDLLDKAIALESVQYKDIIQEDYMDAYRNLSYKALCALRWIDRYCPSAKYIVKVDDDLVVNVFSLVRYLRKITLQNTATTKSFHCLKWVNMPVLRDPNSKWYLSQETYNESYFPHYCSGNGFIMTRDIISDLYNASFYTPFIWVDDAYLTGFLARTANISHHSIEKYYVLKPTEYENALVYGDAIFGHLAGDVQIENRINFWKKIKDVESMTLNI